MHDSGTPNALLDVAIVPIHAEASAGLVIRPHGN